MDTAAIRYRVADFLQKHPPFHLMEEDDLLELATLGRVKFYEPNQYVLSQGASRMQVFVIQQGTVSLWDERGSEARLLDVRGPGDMLGIDQLHEVAFYPSSARSASDVLIYSFPAEDFRTLIERYPGAAQHVSAYGNVTDNSRPSQEHADPQRISLGELVKGRESLTCDAQTPIRSVAHYLRTSNQDAMVMVDSQQRAIGAITIRSLLDWIANHPSAAEIPVSALLQDPIIAIAPEASITDGVLALGGASSDALTITSDGTERGQTQAIVTSRDLGQIFGDRPLEILREIRQASNPRALRILNQRARSFVLRYLNQAASTDWLTHFTSAVDTHILMRMISITSLEAPDVCWCFCGSSGRGESLTMVAPEVVLIAGDDQSLSHSLKLFHRVVESIDDYGYLPAADRSFDTAFHAATMEEWTSRYLDWVSDPIFKEIYLARPLFDLRPIQGSELIWRKVETTVMGAVSREFLHVLSNDCLSILPPLTFFQNAVLDETGEETNVFRLEETALQPLVDVGRVFDLAARRVFGTSTLERFTMAEKLLPQHDSTFREAARAFRAVLWQQGRAGISQGTSGSELPPALLASYDRQVLRSGFRAILRLLEFTGDMEWLKKI